MNDRFKFRFYDNDKKIMIDENTNNKILENEYGEDEWYWCVEAFMPTIFDYFDPVGYDKKDFAIMQCTGLKDKNDKLIYESDIIKIGNGFINGSVIETIREVKWTINTWNVPVWVVDKPNFSHYIEVIGNIYENKELLESEG